ncbi:MAG: hypothetical protein AAF609_24845 [Cyanobacteria bacterium P01_C01_bin.120]
MADLTVQNLIDQLPAATATETADDVTISLKTLMGEASVQFADEKVAEFLTKLLGAAAAAQVDYNAANETNLTGYPTPTFGTPTADGNGNIFSRRTHTVSVQVPVDVNETVGV